MTTIKHTPGVCGGQACINNTRIAVWLIAECWNWLGTVEAVVERWTWEDGLTRDDVLFALDWYQEHREEIDRDILDNERALEELARKWISPEPLTETELAQAQRFAARHGWLEAD